VTYGHPVLVRARAAQAVWDVFLGCVGVIVLAGLGMCGCATPGASTRLADGPVRPPDSEFARALECSPAAPCALTEGVWMPVPVAAYLLGTEAAWQDCRAKCSACPSSGGLVGYGLTCAACAAAGAGTTAVVSK